jgi:hypothetical protein
MQRRACIATRTLSSSVVSPRQTLRELARTTSNIHKGKILRQQLCWREWLFAFTPTYHASNLPVTKWGVAYNLRFRSKGNGVKSSL